MAGEFSGKVVEVTGANGNIGQAVARKFAEQGATLVALGGTPGKPYAPAMGRPSGR